MKKTIRAALNDATLAFQTAGIDQARMDAIALMTHVLEMERTFLVAHPDHELSNEQLSAFYELTKRRAAREPLQYIVGFQEFFKLRFEVSPGVLIPRPETELIVEAALEIADQRPSLSILDLGTGSGCIVISLLHELPQAHALATDISHRALEVAERNSQRYHVRERLTLVQADGVAALSKAAPYSIIVSNPPYVPAGDIEKLQPEVRDHEPVSALVSGVDGLDHIRALVRETPPLTQTNGYFIFEIGFGQSDTVEQLVDPGVWRLIDVRKDLQAIPRTVVLQKR
jgi:release factor glutamine methyltransferase